jgi:hypothetical protein
MKKFIYVLLIVLFASCGARKSQVSTVDTKIDSTTIVKEEVSQVSEKNESLIDTTSIVEEEFEPINDTLPMVIDKKNGVFKNVRFKTSKTKKGISSAKKEESSLEAKKSTLNETSIDIETKDKVTDKEEAGYSWLWILIIAGVILAYIEMKRK